MGGGKLYIKKSALKKGRGNEPSPPVGERSFDDSIRRRDVSLGAFVYRKQVDENSDPPHRSSVHAVRTGCVKTHVVVPLKFGGSASASLPENGKPDEQCLSRSTSVIARLGHGHVSLTSWWPRYGTTVTTAKRFDEKRTGISAVSKPNGRLFPKPETRLA